MRRLSAFISYAHMDKPIKAKLLKHLKVLEQIKMIELWHDEEIAPGSEWDPEIKQELEQADIILLLVSSDFLASEYVWNTEIKRAMERHARGEARVVPIILQPCLWKVSPFGRLKALPDDGKPISQWPDEAVVLNRITESISHTAALMKGAQKPAASNSVPPSPTPGEVFEDPVSGGTYVWIPPGSFTMGNKYVPKGLLQSVLRQFMTGDGSGADEAPMHRVTLTKGFWIGKYPVTQGEWQRVTGANPSHFSVPDRPVEKISWNDANQYVRTLTEKGGDRLYRLPTEAEWEYAARAGTADPTMGFTPDEVGWWQANSDEQTQPVGLKAANAWGLHDLIGNVWEWCSDYYGFYSEAPQTDPQGPPNSAVRLMGETRVSRGGAYYIPLGRVRVSVRNYHSQTHLGPFAMFGLRIVFVVRN